MNKQLLRLKLKKMLPTEAIPYVYDSIVSSDNFDRIVDVVIVKDKINCVMLPCSPRENLKRAIQYYFDSKCPTEATTYTVLEKEEKNLKRDFDKVILEAIRERVIDLEEL